VIAGLTELLDTLDAWADGTAPEDFVFPLVLESTDELNAYRSALRDGGEPLRARLDDLTPDHIAEGALTIEEQTALALALLIQGYQIVRDHRNDPRHIPRGVFRISRRAYRMLKVLGPAIAGDEGDLDWSSLARTVTECRRSMKPLIAERLRASRERAEARKMGDAVSSIDTAANIPGGPVAHRPEETALNALFEETMDTDLLAEMSETQELPGARRTPKSTISVEPVPMAAAATREHRRTRTTTGIAIVGVLLVIAAITFLPRMLQSSPRAGVYEEFVPVRGVVRLRDAPEEMIVLLDDRWDVVPTGEREDALRGLYNHANRIEDITKITVRDARGQDAALIVEGQITILGPD